ncbi:GDSL-type esterase/lipase family protein [Paenibacillus sp. OAS669]|uniref:GDSL-type esterase/lipase family protein n=1 Tax=Paenibacillus sp. OAS669 TaxID=2663821 RepID=UPI00178A2BB9|nr:GDSL-type esterase/lipase family protein [Paenibacillus sp. OAS669]MBE1445456.1 lysophospholipase L1-like esterase [Paenibacillus sp. OAS669]
MGTMFLKDGTVPRSLRIAFLGDSITDNGRYIAFLHAYFAQYMPEQHLTFINLGVSSETASGLSEPEHPFPRPCIHERIEAALRESRPDWVVACYGMNDGIYHPLSEDRFAAYRSGMLSLVHKIRQAGAKAIVMTPPPFDVKSINRELAEQPGGEEAASSYSWKNPYAKYNDVLKAYAEWCLTLQDEVDAVVNIYDPLAKDFEQAHAQNPDYSSGDGIHPNARGHWVIARTLLGRLFNITLERVPEYVSQPESEQPQWFRLVLERHRMLSASWKEHVGHTNPNKTQALPLAEALDRAAELDLQIQGAVTEYNRVNLKTFSEWKGYRRTDTVFEGREAIIIEPKDAAAGQPWIWRTEFFGAFAYADRVLLEQGWHIAYYRISHMYGCAGAVERMRRFHTYVMGQFSLGDKPALFGFSRGGLYAVQYAAAYPSDVLALYLDAPVLDISSWPGGKGKGKPSLQNWEDCLVVYGLTESTVKAFKGNPLDKAEILANAGIPTLIVAGDADEVVPLEENTAVFERKLSQLGGRPQVILKPGVGHHPHSLEQPEPIVEFVQSAYTRALHLQ